MGGQLERRSAVPRSPALVNIQPASATSKGDFLSELRRLLRVADLTLGELEVWAKKNYEFNLPKATLSEALNGKRLIRRRHVLGIAVACAHTPAEVDRWDAAWNEWYGKTDTDQSKISHEVALRYDRSLELERQLTELSGEERLLREALKASSLQLEAIQAELEAAQGMAVSERDRADQLSQQKKRLEQRLADLSAELERVQEERHRAEAERDRVREEYYQKLESIVDVSNLFEDRAQYERGKTERLERQIAELTRQVELLQGRPASLPARTNDDVRTPPASQGEGAFATQNNDVSVELAVTDKDFGSTQTARLECEWYCHRCRRGGQRSYSRCPRCEETTARNYSMPVKVKLRAWRKYGDYIRCTRSGYCDVPFAPPGDVLVRIVRRDEAGVGA